MWAGAPLPRLKRNHQVDEPCWINDVYQDDIIRTMNPDQDQDCAKASDGDDFIGNDIDDSYDDS